jgi:hypothetical protein
MCAYSAVRIAFAGTPPRVLADEDPSTVLRGRLQMWVIVCIGPAAIGYIFLFLDVAQLAIAFPLWGCLAAIIYLLPIWIAVRFFWLSSDDVADYTIEAGQRPAIDAKWERQNRGKHLLLIELVVWIVLLIIGVIWLMALAGLGPDQLFHAFK